jgi:predicted TIM-barrel fold metal-dependent hydrolase
MPLLKEKPSALFKRSSLKVSIEADETLLPETIAAVGIEHFVFATDVPHWDCEFPGNLRHLRGHRGITDEQKQRILYGNAKELFNL